MRAPTVIEPGNGRTILLLVAHADDPASAAQRVGQAHGLTAAEEFRVLRFGGMTGLLERFGRRRN